MASDVTDQRSSLDESSATVREHIEKVVEALVGGSIDSVTVVKISGHPACECSM